MVTDKGIEIEGPLQLDTNWDVAHYVRYVKTQISNF